MSTGTGLPETLDRVGELARQAGADVDRDIEAIRRFIEGPAVVTVAAESADYASGVVALVKSSDTGADVQRTSLGHVPQPDLRDLLVVVTSADRALAQSEEDVVRAVSFLASQSARGLTHELVVTPAGDRWLP